MSAKSTVKSGTQSRAFAYLGWVLFILTVPVLLLALSNSAKSRDIVQRDACVAHLRQLDNAKEKWALEFKKRSGESVENEALTPHLKVPVAEMKCPAGGRYTMNAIGTNPHCSLPGHSLE